VHSIGLKLKSRAGQLGHSIANRSSSQENIWGRRRITFSICAVKAGSTVTNSKASIEKQNRKDKKHQI